MEAHITHSVPRSFINNVLAANAEALKDTKNVVLEGLVTIAGRVVLFRRQGGIAFGKITDSSGSMQFVLQKNKLGPELFMQLVSQCSIGVIVSVMGWVGTTSTGEVSLHANELNLLQKNLMPFPDKWHGIVDAETKLRKRNLDCILDNKVRDTFKFRSRFISIIRTYLEENGFLEVETPVLSAAASGAQANPFVTHHKALDADLYMRIAPETFLKRWTGAGFERVFEIGKNFRNEGMDQSHLQEFTAVEWYGAYFDYMDNLHMFQELLVRFLVARCLQFGGEVKKFDYQGTTLNFTEIPVVTYKELFDKHGLPDPFGMSAVDADNIFKRQIRPHLIQPIVVKDYPAFMMPLAARKKDNDKVAECWQFIVNGWELVKCYSELVDPVVQRTALEFQQLAKLRGYDEAMMLEEDFLQAMEYGMPPQSGLGIGIDRMIALLTDNVSLRDVVMFPTVL